MTTKVAVVTEDRQRVSSHFGMAPLYMVYRLEGNQVIADSQREKPHHQHHPEGHQHGAHGHDDMFAPISDCQVLICGGMGEPAYRKAQAAGLEVVLTGGDVLPAVEAYARGESVNDMRRVHRH